MLRASEARDRAAVIDLFASPEVGRFIGGAQPRADLERTVLEVPGSRAGFFVVERNGVMMGTITLDRRDAGRRGHVAPNSRARALARISPPPEAWGHGYAAEAGAVVLDWSLASFPASPSCCVPRPPTNPPCASR